MNTSGRMAGVSSPPRNASPGRLSPAAPHSSLLYQGSSVCQLAFIFALTLALTACGADKEERRNQALASQQLGFAFLSEGRPARALQELTKAESIEPENPEIKNSVGLAYWARREYSTAETKFREAVALSPKYSEAWNNLGALYIDQSRYDLAVPALEKALENVFYTTHERALANLGWAYYKLGKFSEARAKLELAVDVAPSFPLAQRNLGIVLQEFGEHKGALERFDKTIKLYPDDAETHLRRGISLLKLGNREEARLAFEQAYKLSPTTDSGKSARTYLDLMQ